MLETKFKSISFCTTSMNRLEHLKQTFMLNIESVSDYPNVEFILLNYGSTDDIDEWVKNNLIRYIESGKLIYVKNTDVTQFKPAHSRNVSILASNNNIVCNVDADNFLLKDFAFHLNDLMTKNSIARFNSINDSTGRIGIYREDFIKYGGYNEAFIGYGYEDMDLLERFRANNFKTVFFDRSLVKYIHHSDEERIKLTGIYTKEVSLSNNFIISQTAIQNGIFEVNQNKVWGEAVLIRNFQENIATGVYNGIAIEKK